MSCFGPGDTKAQVRQRGRSWMSRRCIGTSWMGFGFICSSYYSFGGNWMAEAHVDTMSEWSGGTFPYSVGHKKLGMWLFILSDSLTFSAVLFGYSYVRIATPNWPKPFSFYPSVIYATVMTACLLSSSLTMVMAVNASARGNRSGVVKWII